MLISQRTKAGLATATRRGQRLGSAAGPGLNATGETKHGRERWQRRGGAPYFPGNRVAQIQDLVRPLCAIDEDLVLPQDPKRTGAQSQIFTVASS